ncbi:unnamed protein product [Clonostachys chloroleuca]|uniref:Uncharacterized protein n=1 Tax=Clonostachys chloroleuca TaxID=1926264 RepID=A0AA35PVD4_9HYPO|nr:unnamed protein product [Clonostachys chloroleuca]
MRISTVATVVATATGLKAAITAGSLVTISQAADSSNAAAWWSPLDEAGGYSWLAYLVNPSGGSISNNNVMIARRDISSGGILRGCVKTASGACDVFADNIGHNQPSIAIDGDGYVHAFTSMHHATWNYYRSQDPYSVAEIIDASSELPDQSLLFTYPIVKRDAAGDLWLIIRGYNGDGLCRAGYLYHYKTAQKAWARVAIFAYNRQYSIYPDDLQFSSDGDVHIQWEWAKYPASAGRHEGSYLRYRPSTGVFKTIDGVAVSVPVTQSTANLVFQPLATGESYGDDSAPPPMMQSAKLALYENSAGTVLVQHAFRFQAEVGGTWQIRRSVSHRGNGAWTQETIFSTDDTTAALGFTHDGTTARIYFCKKQGSAWALERSASATGWSSTELAAVKGQQVQRLQAILRSDGVDALYLAAPTNVNTTTGSVYFLTVEGRE